VFAAFVEHFFDSIGQTEKSRCDESVRDPEHHRCRARAAADAVLTARLKAQKEKRWP
jgi:hypothetical protein